MIKTPTFRRFFTNIFTKSLTKLVTKPNIKFYRQTTNLAVSFPLCMSSFHNREFFHFYIQVSILNPMLWANLISIVCINNIIIALSA